MISPFAYFSKCSRISLLSAFSLEYITLQCSPLNTNRNIS